MGPGIVTAALVFGPGSLTISTKLGASYGFSLLWVILFATLFMLVFTAMATRIGLHQKSSLIQHIKLEIHPFLALLCGVCIFLITASFQAGNTIGASVSFAELSGLSLWFWISFFSAVSIILLFFKQFYKILERLMIALVTIMLLCFFCTLVAAAPNLLSIIKGFLPSIPSGSDYLIITLTASSFSIVGAFYQSYLVREKNWKKTSKSIPLAEGRTGIITLGLLSSLVMCCASAVLHQNQIVVNSPSDLGKALEPLFGSWAATMFMVGLFAASFSSMIGNATIGGVILSDTFFGRSKLSEWRVRSFIILVILIGAAIALIFGKLPLQLIIFAQGVTILVVPLIAAVIIIFSGTRLIDKTLRNSLYTTIFGLLGLLLLCAMSIYSINYLFFG
ncbi:MULTISPECIES: Nramp family divalent metal transporter [Flavobacteriaceae]|uniref:Nramp family divalent metal transporter n=1 Tax=Flavobacteriaceae TaxID=49546 RepID=UPI001C0EC828|nr:MULTISPECIES: Nramp family divalent metal transporter [Allomuricauda]MDC6366810.1 Nramp family divalent metal transporter [Muricauda sp. AC10]